MYIKTFEQFDLNIEEPDSGYWIVYNHPNGEEILKWLEDNLGTKKSPLKEFTSKKRPESKFYGKSKDNLLLRWYDYQKQYQKNDILYVNYHKIWSVFSKKFDLNYDDTKLVMMWWAVDTLQIKASNISNGTGSFIPNTNSIFSL